MAFFHLYYSVLTDWRASHGARNVEHCQHDKSEMWKWKKQNKKIICDETRAEKFKFIRVECPAHRTVCQQEHLFFRSLAKDNLADYSSRARRQFGALSCLASCFVNSFLFHFFSRVSRIVCDTNDNGWDRNGSALALTHYYCYYFGDERVGKVLISATKIDVLTWLQPFSCESRVEKPTVEHLLSRCRLVSFCAPEPSDMWQTTKATKTLSPSGWSFYFYSAIPTALVCQSLLCAEWNLRAQIAEPFDTPPLTSELLSGT